MSPPPEYAAELLGRLAPLPLRVLKLAPHTLFVAFEPGEVPESGAEFSGLLLRLPGRELTLGRCRFLLHQPGPLRRAGDTPPVGDGKLLFLDNVYDFGGLLRGASVVELSKRLEQLPALWSRKENLRPSFRAYTAELVFDLQVYRGLLDEVDRNLAEEPPAVRAEVHRVVAASEYGNFKELFDRKLAELAAEVAGYSAEEHERHGFYLRKHVWDIILSSEFLRRTNLKPHGYAGDSAMMRAAYENQFRGPTAFSRFMHKHPLESVAAQAVRNRVALLSTRLVESSQRKRAQGDTRPLRVMSVAAGPAWELREVLKTPADLARYDLTLLDQDPVALADARAGVGELETRLGGQVQVRYVQDSVRTMMRDRDLAGRWGRFDLMYSMGLFDYLTAPTAKVVLKRLFALVEPGGQLVVGNFHTSNPSRMYMEYWMDWVLIYRSEAEMLDLAQGLEDADCTLQFEETGSQMFLCITRRRSGGSPTGPTGGDARSTA